MKKGIRQKVLGFLLVAMVYCLTGCGNNTQGTTTVSMYDLCQVMEEADASLPEMLYASSSEENADDLFSHVSDMDYEKVDSFFVSYSKEGKADEIVVVAVKDPADIEEAKKSLMAHKEDRYKLLEQYEPKEVSRIDDGIIFTEKQYAVLIICDDANSVRHAFEKQIKEA